MGLDVMFYRISKPRERKQDESLNDYLWAIKGEQDKQFAKDTKAYIKNWLKDMKKFKETYNGETISKIRSLYYEMKNKYFEYEFELDALDKAKTVKDVEAWFKDIHWEWFSKPDAAYFRKVNSIYAYFADRLDDETCVVTKADIIDIMNKATEVLSEHDEETSMKLLPTQGGFFFGSTDYDDWYYEDMITILKEFGKLLKDWTDDNDIVFVHMSW